MEKKQILILVFFLCMLLPEYVLLKAQTSFQLYTLSKEKRKEGDFSESKKILLSLLSGEKDLSVELKIYVLNQLGIINDDIGDYSLALKYYNQAEKTCIDSFKYDYSFLSLIYNNIAIVYRKEGDYEKAMEYYTEALNRLKESELSELERDYEASKLNLNIGVAKVEMQRFREAIPFLTRSFMLKSKYNFDGVANALHYLAKAYNEQEDLKKAEEFYMKSIKEWEKPCNKKYLYLTGPVNIDYARLLQKLNQKDKALFYYQKGNKIYLKTYGKRHPYTAESFKNLADFYLLNNQVKKALDYYQQSIIANTQQFSNSDIYSLPALDLVISDIQFQQSLKKKAEALVLYSKQKKDRTKKIKDLEASLITTELLLKHVSKIRQGYLAKSSKLNITKEEKSSYFYAINASLGLYELTKKEKYKEKAYAYVQKSKASLLREEIMQNEAYMAILPESERKNKSKLEKDIYMYKKLVFDENQRLNPDKNKVEKWSHKLFKLNNEYADLTERISTEYKKYHSLIGKTSIESFDELKGKLNKDECVVEYFISPPSDTGQQQLLIFAISKKGLNYSKVGINKHFFDRIAYVREQMNRDFTSKTDIESFNQLNYSLHQLYKKLIQPVEKHFQGTKIYVVPDEEIAYLSFDALQKKYVEQKTINYAAVRYLIYDYCFSYAYSSGLLFQEVPQTTKSKYVYAFAPDYTGTGLSNTRMQFGKLENTENEINNILKWFNGRALVGRQANEEFFKSISGEGGIFHFAMHASAEKNNPDFSFLAITQNDSNAEDGLFYNYEIAMMKMNATMVVLSGCNTGDGIISSGEGVMSLTRNFILAGAPSIVHSLWEVQDETSVEIMQKFYENLSKGVSKSEALRQAKLHYIQNVTPAMVNPYFWSGYVHTGNPVPVVKTKSHYYFIAASLLFLLLIVVIYRRKKKTA